MIGDLDIYVLQIVGAGSLDPDDVMHDAAPLSVPVSVTVPLQT